MKHNSGLTSAIADALAGGTSAAALTAGASAAAEPAPAVPAVPAAAAPEGAPAVPAATAIDADAIRADAIKTERTRVAGINALPTAATRPAATAHAIESGMTVEAATTFLAKMPEESAGGGRETLGDRMGREPNAPRPGADTGRKPADAAVAIDGAAIFRDRAKAQNLPH